MGLVKCVDCGREISDRSERCPECGCPTQLSIENHMQEEKNKTYCVINGQKIDLTILVNGKVDGLGVVDKDGKIIYTLCDLCDNAKISGEDAYKIFEMASHGNIPREYNCKTEIPIQVNELPKPKCPTCGSTNIKRISGTERAVSVFGLGLFSKKINKSFKCNNCGYTW